MCFLMSCSLRAKSPWLCWTWALRLQGWTRRWGPLWGWRSLAVRRSTLSTTASKDSPMERWGPPPPHQPATGRYWRACVRRWLRWSGTVWRGGRAKGAHCWAPSGEEQFDTGFYCWSNLRSTSTVWYCTSIKLCRQKTDFSWERQERGNMTRCTVLLIIVTPFILCFGYLGVLAVEWNVKNIFSGLH